MFPQGCYSAVVDYFELYIYVAGALAIVVLTIEVGGVFIPHICSIFLCLSSDIVNIYLRNGEFGIKLKMFA